MASDHLMDQQFRQAEFRLWRLDRIDKDNGGET